MLGHSIQRSEDPALLTGAAEFLPDLRPGGMLHAVFVRSTAAHGSLRAVDVTGARDAPGVHSVWTAADLDLPPQQAFGGEEALARPRLATERVRYVGEPVAVVVAETEVAARDAAEQVVVDVEPLAVVVDPLGAADEAAAVLFPDHGTNVVAGRHRRADDVFFDDAEVVVRLRMTNQRVAPVPLEPNGCLAVPDGGAEGGGEGHGDGLTVWASTQSVFSVRDEVCGALGLDADAVRVRTAWVGGGFGAKGGAYPEQVIVAALARRTGRPVRWVETRTENLLGMTHGRAQTHEVALGATGDGRLTGMAVRGWADVGAYPVRGVFMPMVTRYMASGVYALPKVDFQAVTVVTNTTPVGPYRGAGRPEAAALTERAIDLLADRVGLDPAEVRRRNFPDPASFPFTTATGATYDTGDYAKALDEVLRLSGYDELRAEQRRRRDADDPAEPLLGVGLACYVEVSGRGGEFGSVRVEGDGTITVITGSVPHGQGHETVWAQIAAAVLGVPLEMVRVAHSDTAIVDHGVGTFGSRSLQLAGSAVHQAATGVWERARVLAADLLEAAPDDVVAFDDGRVGVAGVPATALGWADLAAEAGRRGSDLAEALDFDSPDGSFPFGAHVAVVEVDRETGKVRLVRMVAVDDCGTVVNPLLAEGQVHGGLAQGVAQILLEAVRYDEDGNPLTASLLDYYVPSAADLPSFETGHTVTPTPNNPLGAKGIGESGTTGSISAVWNAVIDALEPFGVEHLDPPFSPEVVWRAMQREA